MRESPVEEINTRSDGDVLNDILDNVLTINKKVSRRSGHDKYVDPHHAEELLNRFLKMDLDREDIEEALEDIVPRHWTGKKLRAIFGKEQDE
ncbi:hypothetical protein MNBD_GAMMA17-1730 [hydrothermal vent metagenome]|uniref:Uncharacterized protein n=1 Tax=hydrothermal vent metagenome TaxID=652676 RepID=A0A3B0ZAP6_9ZZZZ